jgi:hypothetical protein
MRASSCCFVTNMFIVLKNHSWMNEDKPSMKVIMSLEGYGMSDFNLEAELITC